MGRVTAVRPALAPRGASAAPAARPVVALSPRRLLGLAPAGLSLIAGLTGALVLLGVAMPSPTARLAGSHGLLMTLGFLGTLVALERAVALGRGWGWGAPVAAGLGGVALVAGAPAGVAPLLFAVAATVYLAMYLAVLGLDRGLHTWVQGSGAVAWVLAAALLAAGRPVNDAVPALAAFLVLTVAGERLELARLGQLTRGRRAAFLAAAGLFGAGVLLATWLPDAGVRLGGAGLLAIAAWLARYDIARRTVRLPGVTRFIALCLLSGYAWLAVGGATWLAWGAAAPALARDAMLHAIFLGFVISMVYGHAPVILPAVLRVPLPYRPVFYGHLLLLHAGLVVRVIAGDIGNQPWAWQAGGVLTVVSMLVFAAVSIVTVVGATLALRAAATGPHRPGAFRTRGRDG